MHCSRNCFLKAYNSLTWACTQPRSSSRQVTSSGRILRAWLKDFWEVSILLLQLGEGLASSYSQLAADMESLCSQLLGPAFSNEMISYDTLLRILWTWLRSLGRLPCVTNSAHLLHFQGKHVLTLQECWGFSTAYYTVLVLSFKDASSGHGLWRM